MKPNRHLQKLAFHLDRVRVLDYILEMSNDSLLLPSAQCYKCWVSLLSTQPTGATGANN